MPFSSSTFTREASLKRGGGDGEVLLILKLFQLEDLHIVKIRAACWRRLIIVVLLVFRNLVDLEESVEAHDRSAHPEVVGLAILAETASIFAVVTSKMAGTICEATNRFQISV